MESSGSSARAVSHRRVVAALAVAVVAFAYQQTAVIPVISVIEKALHIPRTWGAWLLSGYLLIATVAGPLLGRLGDRYGRRTVLMTGLVVFAVGSVGAAVSPDAAVLIGCRALQGVGGAVFPLALSVVRQELPHDRINATTGLLTGAFGIGTALGFATSGALTAAVSWRLVFAVGAVVVALAVPMVAAWVPARPGRPGGDVDLPGAALLGGALGLLLVALTLAPQAKGAGWGVPAGLLVVAVLAAVGWLRRERTARTPLIDWRTLRSPTELWTNSLTLAIGYTLFGIYYLVPQFVRNRPHGFGVGLTLVGLFLVPAAVGQLLAGPAAGLLQRHGHARHTLAAGLAMMAVGAGGFAWIGRGSEPVFLVCAFVLGCGTGLAISSSSTLASLGTDEEHAAVATSMNTTARRVGGGVGSQVSAGVLMAAGTGTAAWVVAFGLAAVVCLVCVPVSLRLP
jgi:MFS family permease